MQNITDGRTEKTVSSAAQQKRRRYWQKEDCGIGRSGETMGWMRSDGISL